MTRSLDAKGALLEQKVAAYFRLNGYEADLNAKIEGKSGAIHEIDVLAKKSDGITEFVLAVECKAWSEPIEKDVVSKLSMIMTDIGINKGIIVSLQGWRIGAEKTAAQEKIELWGPDELTQRLGSVELAQLNNNQGNLYTIDTISDAPLSDTVLRPVMESQSRGLFGLGSEEEAWADVLWIPFHLIELHLSTVVKEFLRRPTIKVTPVWSLYNAIDDTHFMTMSVAPATVSQPQDHVIPAKTKSTGLASTFMTTWKKFREVTTESAKARYRDKLKSLGLSDNLENLTVEHSALVYYPFFVGMFRRRGNERLIAVNACTGKFDQATSHSLTQNLAYVTKSIKTAPHPE